MIRVFTHRNKWTPEDDLTFVGWPTLFQLPDQPVRISIVFTWDRALGKRLHKAWSLYYSDVRLGGPAFGDPGGSFVPGRYIKEGVTITSRGCSKRCPWCFVPEREGKIRELRIEPGYIVQDNNLLACSKGHIERVFEMLRSQNRGISFNGGIDATLLRNWHRPLFDSIKVKEIWLACDTQAALYPLERAASILEGVPINKKRCYVMVGFDGETLALAEKRLETVYELGFLPFAQLYRGEGEQDYSDEWESLARKWSRPAAYRATNKADTADKKQRAVFSG